MVSTRRRALAALVLATALGPWLATAFATVHVLSDHDAADHAAPGDFDDPLHGHHHEPRVPLHEHVAVLRSAPPLVARTSHAVIAAEEAFLVSGPVTMFAPVMKPSVRWQQAAPGPPPCARSVILRI